MDARRQFHSEIARTDVRNTCSATAEVQWCCNFYSLLVTDRTVFCGPFASASYLPHNFIHTRN